jgi:hypothetical protein
MQASQAVWRNWHEQVKHVFVTLHGHQQKTLALMVLRIVVSGSAVLQRMAERVQQGASVWPRCPALNDALRGLWPTNTSSSR